MNDISREWPARPRSVPSIFATGLWLNATLSLLFFAASLAFCFMVLSLAFSIAAGQANFGPATILAGIAVIIAALFAALGLKLARIVRRKRQLAYRDIQRERDVFAGKIADLLERGETAPPFSLYLRPFFTDGELTADEGYARLLAADITELADYGQTHDSERAIAQAMEDYAPTLSLGRPSDRLGAGRIETDDDNWKACFERLIGHAERIFMVPIGQPATMQEVRTIAVTPELLAKTVFIRPANRKRQSFAFAPDTDLHTIGGMWDWTRDHVLDVLPSFPRFGHSARLIAFPEGEAPVEYRGNGVASVQLPSGLRKFATQGNTRLADLWLVAILLIASTLPALLYVPFDLSPSNFGATLRGSYSGQSVSRAADTLFFYQMLFISTSGLAAYKFVTGDIPFRIGLPLTMVWLIFIVNSAYLGWALPRAAAGETFTISPGVVADVLGSANFMIFGYITVALLTNNALRISGLLVPATLYLIWVCLTVGRAGGSGATHFAASALLLALALAMPLWLKTSAWQRGAIVLAALLASAAAYGLYALGASAFMQWQAALDEARMTGSIYSLQPDRLGEYEMAWASNWARLWRCMGFAVPIIGFGFLARTITGQGRTRRWADELSKYPH